MCIRITKELKTVYEQTEKIDLSQKIDKGIFCRILKHLGYIDSGVAISERMGQLIELAWRTIRTKCKKGELLKEEPQPSSFNNEGDGPADGDYEEEKEIDSNSDVDCVTFENFAMLLNLINNVYIKSTIQAKSANEIIEEEEEDSEGSKRPFGYVDF